MQPAIIRKGPSVKPLVDPVTQDLVCRPMVTLTILRTIMNLMAFWTSAHSCMLFTTGFAPWGERYQSWICGHKNLPTYSKKCLPEVFVVMIWFLNSSRCWVEPNAISLKAKLCFPVDKPSTVKGFSWADGQTNHIVSTCQYEGPPHTHSICV